MIELRAKVGAKGQIVIPKAIRETLDIHAREVLIFRVEDDEIVLRKENGAEILEKMFSLFPNKIPVPDDIDWDELYYSQFEDDLKKYEDCRRRERSGEENHVLGV